MFFNRLDRKKSSLHLEACGHGNNPRTGYSTTLWYSVIRRANQETVRQCKEDYPVDFLFQDQVGTRKSQYDFNPASPTVYPYTVGLMEIPGGSNWQPKAALPIS